MQWNYQLTKQNWAVCELGTVVLFTKTGFQNFFVPEKVYVRPSAFRETGPSLIASSPAHAGSSLSEFPFRRGFSRNGVGKLAAAQGLFLI